MFSFVIGPRLKGLAQGAGGDTSWHTSIVYLSYTSCFLYSIRASGGFFGSSLPFVFCITPHASCVYVICIRFFSGIYTSFWWIFRLFPALCHTCHPILRIDGQYSDSVAFCTILHCESHHCEGYLDLVERRYHYHIHDDSHLLRHPGPKPFL